MKANKRELIKIGKWLVDGNTGLSSEAMASFILTVGNGGECPSRLVAPSDPSDFRRCVNFLNECIDKSKHLSLIYQLGQTTTKWKIIQREWIPLLKLYEYEKNKTTAPKLYKFMKKIGL